MMRRVFAVATAAISLLVVVSAAIVYAQETNNELSGYQMLEDVRIAQRLQQAEITDEQATQLLSVVQDYLAGRAGPDNPSPADDPLTRDLLARARKILLSGQPLPADLQQQVQEVIQAIIADRQRPRQVRNYAVEQIKKILSDEQINKLTQAQGGTQAAGGAQNPQNRFADRIIMQLQKLKNLGDNEWEGALDNALQQILGQRMQPGTARYQQLKASLTELARKIRGMTNADIETHREELRADVMAALMPKPPPPPQGGQQQRPALRAGSRPIDPALLALRYLSDYRTVRVLEEIVNRTAAK